MPLERNTGWIDDLANRIGAFIAGSGGNDGKVFHFTFKLGEETLIDRVIEGINGKSFELNEEVIVQ